MKKSDDKLAAPARERVLRDERTDANDKRDVSIYLTVELHRALKVYAAQNDEKVSDVVERACRAYLAAGRIHEHGGGR